MANIIIQDEETGKEITYYMDDRLKKRTDEKVIPALHKSDKDWIEVIDGGEGCFSEDTLIDFPKGILSIKELIEINEVVINTIGLNLENNKIEINKSAIIPRGKQEVYEIETIDGRKIQTTLNHRFFIEREGLIKEIKLKNLEIGDKLICEKKFQKK